MDEEQKKIEEFNNEKKPVNWKIRLIAHIVLFVTLWVILIADSIYIYNSAQGTVNQAGKPIIYLYPTKETEINVSLGKKENIIVSYPKYKDMWKVIASPDGKLIDKDTGKTLYSLYYEANTYENYDDMSEGFCIKGEDTAEFLDEKLEILGLNYKEREEFIVYWLPKLEANKYNYIRFANKEEIEKIMPLNIDPKPDTLIRVFMIFKGLDNRIDLQTQTLEKMERKGYVAVEWGAINLDK